MQAKQHPECLHAWGTSQVTKIVQVFIPAGNIAPCCHCCGMHGILQKNNISLLPHLQCCAVVCTYVVPLTLYISRQLLTLSARMLYGLRKGSHQEQDSLNLYTWGKVLSSPTLLKKIMIEHGHFCILNEVSLISLKGSSGSLAWYQKLYLQTSSNSSWQHCC